MGSQSYAEKWTPYVRDETPLLLAVARYADRRHQQGTLPYRLPVRVEPGAVNLIFDATGVVMNLPRSGSRPRTRVPVAARSLVTGAMIAYNELLTPEEAEPLLSQWQAHYRTSSATDPIRRRYGHHISQWVHARQERILNETGLGCALLKFSNFDPAQRVALYADHATAYYLRIRPNSIFTAHELALEVTGAQVVGSPARSHEEYIILGTRANNEAPNKFTPTATTDLLGLSAIQPLIDDLAEVAERYPWFTTDKGEALCDQ